MKKISAIILTIIIVTCQSISVLGAVSDYGGQLSAEEKDYYNSLYDFFYLKSSKKEYFIETNLQSTTLKNTQVQEQLSDKIRIAYSALMNDHPEFYWATSISISHEGFDYFENGVFQYSVVENNSILITGNTPHGKKAKKKFNKAVNKAVKKINQYAGKNPGRAKLIKAINQWICRNTKYDNVNGNSSDTKYEYLHNAYGVFVKKKAVCDGYSAAFKLLCDYYGIPCMINLGYAYDDNGNLGRHAWNLVRVKRHWYIVDSTWNDTNSSTKWLLCGKKIIKTTHLNSKKRLDVMEKGYFKLSAISKKSYIKK